ncbi:hypothetical protein PYCC9005_000251 [Savitreella phatthalungensis]
MVKVYEVPESAIRSINLAALDQFENKDRSSSAGNDVRAKKRRRSSSSARASDRSENDDNVTWCDVCFSAPIVSQGARNLTVHEFEVGASSNIGNQGHGQVKSKGTKNGSKSSSRWQIVLPNAQVLLELDDWEHSQLLRGFNILSDPTMSAVRTEYADVRISRRLHVSISHIKVYLTITSRSRVTWSLATIKLGKHPLFRRILLASAREVQTRVATPELFYASAPAPQAKLQHDIPGLKTKLLNYQRKSVAWMLEREHGAAENSSAWAMSSLLNGQIRGLQLELGLVASTSAIAAQRTTLDYVAGGLLADEMGLGKTVEVLATLLMHTRPPSTADTIYDVWSGQELESTGATLIITPSTIAAQWLLEIGKHTGLKSRMYTGAAHDQQLSSDLNQYDIVVTTYRVLTSDVHYVRAQSSTRELRGERKYEQRRSPLLSRQWWRVVMDEAQMVQSGSSAAAEVAALIPRVHAWAVTGTPVGTTCSSLFGVLHFLRLRPFHGNPSIWHSLCNTSPFAQDQIASIFGPITCRQTKSGVQADLDIPAQRRFVVPIKLSPIEESNFQDLLAEAFRDIGLDEDGQPRDDTTWDDLKEFQIARMLHHIGLLRQACTHPQIGAAARVRFGIDGRIKPMSEVLRLMRRGTEASLEIHGRQVVSLQITRGQIYEYVKQPEEALKIFQSAVSISSDRIAVLETLVEHVPEAKGLDGEPMNIDLGDGIDAVDLQRSRADNGLDSIDSQTDIRLWKEILHRALFFTASIHFQLQQEEEERRRYTEAKSVRHALLGERETAVIEIRAKVIEKQRMQSFIEIPEMRYPQLAGLSGHSTLLSLEKLTDMLNDQANELDKFREACIERLTGALADENDDPSGEEYQKSLDDQEESFLYLELIKIMLNDRCRMLDHRLYTSLMRDDLRKWTETERQKAGKIFIDGMKVRDSLRPLPDPSTTINHVNACTEAGCLKDIRDDLASREMRYRGSDTHGARMERELLMRTLSELDRTIASQRKAYDGLRQEENELRKLYNLRVLYYRQFQDLSDAVQAFTVLRRQHDKDGLDLATGKHLPNEELTEEDISESERAHRLANMTARIEASIAEEQAAVDRGQARLKYLNHLSDTSKAVETCIICQTDFSRGALTFCGHLYCRECFLQWHRSHATCPICKTKLQRTGFYDISLGGTNIVKNEPSDGGDSAHNPVAILGYEALPVAELSSLARQTLQRSFSSKVDSIVQHIKSFQAGTKSIIYSNFADVLYMFAEVLQQNGIGVSTLLLGSHLQLNNQIDRFLAQRTTEVLLMTGRSQAAGLNLTVATKLFLVEPLVNPAIEAQLQGRIHRIGQHESTSVYQYYVVDTVEEAILRGNVTRGVSTDEGNNRQLSDVQTSNSGGLPPGHGGASTRAGERIGRADVLRLFQSNLGRKTKILETSHQPARPNCE